MPTSTAAAPTKLCSIATSSGIDVIATRDGEERADDAPDAQRAGQHADDRRCPARRDALSPDGRSATAVTTTASSMPRMPKRFPRRALSCVESPRRLRMKSRLATR